MRRHLLRLALVLGVALGWTVPVHAQLVAAVLPSSRSVTVGTAATAFATIINAGTQTATSCRLVPISAVPASFSFQTTDPATNRLTGTVNTPVAISPGGAATFVFAFTPSAAFPATDVRINFTCSNTVSAPIVTGLNTLLLTASATPVPDVIALAATTTSDGRVQIPAVDGVHAFAVATANVGATGTITVTADTGNASISISLKVCQTNPSTGACLAPPAPTVTTSIASSGTPTFGLFVQATGAVAFDPAQKRVFVRFKDAGGVTRGSTSVAVNTPAGDFGGTYNGSATFAISGCRNPDDNGTFRETFTFTLPPTRAQSSGGSAGFSTSTTVTDDDGATVTFSISGTATTAGAISGRFDFTIVVPGTPTSTGGGTLTGTVAPSSISIVLSGQDTSGDTCRFTLTIAGTR